MQQLFRGPPKAVILFCKCTWTWHLILSWSAEWQGFIVRQVQHDAKFNLSTKRHDKRENTVCSPKHELWINDRHWAVSTVDWKGGCKEKITEENLSIAKRATALLCAWDHKVSFCKSIYGTPGPHCLSASCHPLWLLRKEIGKREKRKQLHLAHVKRAALQ